MTRVVLTPELRDTLHGLVEPLELCDTAGNVIARVTPVVEKAKSSLEPQVSEEELDRREAANERRYTTDEVIAHLQSL